jgi:hypothetical protein
VTALLIRLSILILAVAAAEMIRRIAVINCRESMHDDPDE